MAKRYNEKKAKQAMEALERELNTGQDKIDLMGTLQNDLKASAMGEGEEELFERKLTKEEAKAAKKAAREAKKKAKVRHSARRKQYEEGLFSIWEDDFCVVGSYAILSYAIYLREASIRIRLHIKSDTHLPRHQNLVLSKYMHFFVVGGQGW